VSETVRYFLTYRGVRLPLTLTEELAPEALQHRNTYLRAGFDAAGRTLWLEKRVYGEVEMRHDYRWHDDGRLAGATVRTLDEEPRELSFD
jgi:Family of unknown function (DUF6156)